MFIIYICPKPYKPRYYAHCLYATTIHNADLETRFYLTLCFVSGFYVLKFWACNEVKFAVDRCFKAEKQELLISVNLDFESKRKQEDDAIRDAIGREQSFEEYLKTDKTYLKEMEKAKKSTKVYSERANAR